MSCLFVCLFVLTVSGQSSVSLNPLHLSHQGELTSLLLVLPPFYHSIFFNFFFNVLAPDASLPVFPFRRFSPEPTPMMSLIDDSLISDSFPVTPTDSIGNGECFLPWNYAAAPTSMQEADSVVVNFQTS